MDRRTATSKTFATGRPGEFETRLYDGPVHFKDARGRWADIDSALGPVQDGRRKNRANSFGLILAEQADDASLARVTLDAEHSVSFRLDGAAKVKAKAERDRVTYPKVRQGTDLRLSSRRDGMKEELLLASPAAPDRFIFPLQLRGLTASIDEAGDVVYTDAQGRERARTPHGFMYDSRVDPASGEAATSLGVTYALTRTLELGMSGLVRPPGMST